MLALKKLNNNAVICKDSVGRELIATGKGIGFGTLPREVSLEEIERTFYDTDPSYRAVLRELPPEVVSLAGQLVDIAANELPYELSPNLVLTLADHIAFAVERARKQMNVRMPLAYDVEQHYPAEYRLGKYALQRIRRELRGGLPPNEAVGIALGAFLRLRDKDEKALSLGYPGTKSNRQIIWNIGLKSQKRAL